MSITSLVRHIFVPRMHELDKHLTQGEQLQGRVLSHLLLSAQDTEYGREHTVVSTVFLPSRTMRISSGKYPSTPMRS